MNTAAPDTQQNDAEQVKRLASGSSGLRTAALTRYGAASLDREAPVHFADKVKSLLNDLRQHDSLLWRRAVRAGAVYGPFALMTPLLGDISASTVYCSTSMRERRSCDQPAQEIIASVRGSNAMSQSGRPRVIKASGSTRQW